MGMDMAAKKKEREKKKERVLRFWLWLPSFFFFFFFLFLFSNLKKGFIYLKGKREFGCVWGRRVFGFWVFRATQFSH